MKNILRLACLSALLTGVGASATGCLISECDDGDSNCVQLEPVTIYEGQERSDSTAWTTGQPITIKNDNGQIKVTVGSADTVGVTFKPFTGGDNTPEAKEKAQREMDEDIQYIAAPGDGGVLIQADKTSGNGFLGAHMDVTLPANFDGDLYIDSDNGSTKVDLRQLNTAGIGAVTIETSNGGVEADLNGLASSVTIAGEGEDDTGAGSVVVGNASGRVNISGGFDVSVSFARWPAADEDGTITGGGPGDLAITVPVGAQGSIQATACGSDGVVNSPSPLPSDWSEEAASAGSKTFGFGADPGSGGNVVVTCDGLIGDVHIIAKQ